MTSLKNNLRWNILGCPTETECLGAGLIDIISINIFRIVYKCNLESFIYLDPLSQPHVSQLEVSIATNEAVLRLDIPVDDGPGVQVVQGFHHTPNVEPGSQVRQVTVFSKQGPQLPALADLHHHVQVICVLEGAVQLDDELAVQGRMNISL